MCFYQNKYAYSPLVFIMLILLFLMCGCGGKEQAQKKPVGSDANQQEIKIAVSLADMERDENQIIKKTMSERQGQINITWLDAQNDAAKQAKDLEALINQKVKVVILQLVDPATGPLLVRKLAQANIKVIALGKLPANSPLDGYIAPDYARAGELQSRYLLNAARGRPASMKTVILQGDKNDYASREITAAVLENLKQQALVQVVQVKEHPAGAPQMAQNTLEQVLTNTNNQIDAVLATDDRISAGVAEVLKNRGMSRQIITVGAGAGKLANQTLASGEHDAEVDLMPELLAQYAYDAATGLAATGHWQYDRQIKNGDFDVPARITPVRLITANESYLLEQRWGKPEGQAGEQNGQQGQQQQQGAQNSGQANEQKQSNNQGEQGNSKKTTLRVTTQDGKTVEMQINGEIKKIETIDSAGEAKNENNGRSQAGNGAGKGS